MGTWRERGAEVTFEELAAEPTVAHWARLLEHAAPAPPRTAETVVPDADAPFPLATMQHAYWIGRQDGQPLGGVAAHFYTEFDGRETDPERLDAAVAAVTERHPMLRARFLDDGRQRVEPPGRHRPVTVHDLRGLPPADVERRLAELRDQATHRRMDVASGHVLDVALSLLPGGATRLHVDLDMIVADALSLRVLLEDLTAAYDGRALPPLEYGFARYLAERARRDTPARDRARRWWRRRLADLPPPPELPTVIDATRPTPAGSPHARSTRLHHWIDPERSRRLAERARAHGLTPAAALATAFAEVLGAWSASPRFLLNLPLFDRAPLHPDVDRVLGDFSGSVLVAADVTERLPFAQRARRTQDELRRAIDHGAYSGVEVLRDLARAAGGAVLAPVVYTSAIGLGPLFTDTVQRRFGRPSWIISQGPQVWLDAQVTELDGGLLLNWDARERVFAPGFLGAAFAAYRDLVDALVDDPDAWQTPYRPDLPEVRRRAAAPDADLPEARTLHRAFFERAGSAPGRTALVAPDGTGTGYGELAERALRVAGALAPLTTPGDTVAVTLPRGPEQVAAVLGVLAAGCAYLPVGADQPPARRARVLSRGSAALVVTDAAGAAAADPDVPVLDLAEALAADPLPRPRDVPPDAPAYLLFTSGSTGEPKGVQVPHRAAAHTVDVLNARLGMTDADRTLALAEADFDMSVYDLFAPLSAGGAAVLVADDARRDAPRWARGAVRGGVTVLNCVPTFLDMLLTAAESGTAELPPLRAVLLGGERIGADLPARLRAFAPGCRFLALGGMTEAAIHSTVQEVDRADPAWHSVPWGRPLPGVRCRVVDSQERDRPDWVPGELWVGGAGLADGYRGDPAATADRFVERDGQRWYRTGDLLRYLPDGTLDFLGRVDRQVKVRGVRVELGEIEAALRAHPEVAAAVALVEDTPAPRLAAAVVADDDGTLPGRLAAHAASLLPAAMLPERIAVVESLPLTANGKPDRAAVARLVRERSRTGEGTGDAPRGPVEHEVARVWADLLDRDRVSRDDDFFALGGDSLLATRVVAALRAAGHADAGVARLFSAPVLRDFAASLTGRGEARHEPVVRPDPEHRHDPFPPTEVQRAYLLGRSPEFTLGGVGTYHYSEFDGAEVDLDRLEKAWNRLVRRHEMLRAVFDDHGDQRVLPRVPAYRIAVTDACDADPEPALAELRERMSHRLFDPTRWPLFEVRAVRYVRDGARRTRVGIGLDYIVLDALSIMTLYTELDRLHTDPDAPLPPVDVSFRDYVTQVEGEPERVEAARAYWRERVAALPPAPDLPLAVDPADVREPRFTRRADRLAPEQWRALTGLARSAGITPSTLLLACYADVLAAWSGQTELSLTLTLFNRSEVHPHISRVLGDFTSLSLTSYRRDPGQGLLEAARALQRRLGADLDHRDVSASWVLRELARRTGTAQPGVPVVFTSSLGVGGEVSMDTSPDFPERIWGLSQSPQVHLDNQVLQVRGGLDVYWDAVEELFRPGVLDAMFAAYLRLLRDLAATGRIASPADVLPREQRAERDRVNAPAAPVTRATLHGAVFAAADRAPERPAVVTDGGVLSHGALAERALRIAAGLRRRGVAPDDAVAVCLPKGPDQVAAVLGVLAAGAVYVPVGPDQPPRRRDRIHRAARTVFTVGEGGDPGRSAAPEELYAEPPLAAPVPRSPDDLAYVIFTSGSTGEPKGVEVTHAAAAATVADVNERHGTGPDDRVLGLSALDFDLSVYDVFGLLGAGGAVVLPAEEERRDAARWRDLAVRHRVTVWNTVPALLDMLLLAAEGAAFPPHLRLALVSGDWVGTDLAARLRDATAGRARLVALGGATEAAIWSNAFDGGHAPPGWPSVPYGYPLRNQRYRVVDAHGRDCPDWVPGELWIGGGGVARGYRGDPERTRAKFVTVGGQRWYRTGDLGRYRPGGVLEFLGRMDRQVKVAGHRLEPGEVEAALEEHPAVRRAAVVAVGPRERRRLCAFVLAQDPAPDPGDLAAHLAERLPRHAVPAVVETVAEFPLTPNGKVDAAALAERAAPAAREGCAAPADDVERGIAEVWSGLLDAPVTDREANFFALGGTSLLAIRMVGELRRVFGVEVSTRAFLAEPTLAALAGQLRYRAPAGTLTEQRRALLRAHRDEVVALLRAEEAPSLTPDPARRHDAFPLTDVQGAYLVGRGSAYDYGGVACHAYAELDLPPLDPDRLRGAWDALVRRHDMLRAVVSAEGHQRVLAEAPGSSLTVTDARGGDVEARVRHTRERLRDLVPAPGTWPLVRLHLTRGADRSVLHLSADLLVADYASVRLLLDELAALYADPDHELPEVRATFRDYVLAQRALREGARHHRDRAYWMERIDDLPPAPELPLLDRAADAPARFTRRSAALSPAEWEALRTRTAARGVTPSSVALVAYAETVARWSRRPDLTLNLPAARRLPLHPDVDRIVGDFTTVTLLAVRADDGATFAERARTRQARLIEDLDHSLYSGVELLAELSRRRDEAAVLMPVVFTGALGADAGATAGGSWADREVHGVSQTPQVWLDCQVTETGGGLSVRWDVRDGVLCDGVADDAFAAYVALLRDLAASDEPWDAASPVRLPEHQRRRREQVNATAGPLPDGLLHEEALAAALRTPDAPAVVTSEGTLGHAQLWGRAAAVAAVLAERGCRPGDRIAVVMDKGVEQIVAVCAVLLAGAAYVPVDVAQPAARRTAILDDAGVRCVLTQSWLAAADWGAHADPVAVDLVPAAEPPAQLPPRTVGPDDLAYVIYTSGSTGTPKGVMISHRAARNTVDDVNRRFAVTAEDRVLGLASLGFDLSVYDVFGPLAAGGAIVLPDAERRGDPSHWAESIAEHGVTLWNSVPAQMQMLCDYLDADRAAELPALRLALLSGDWIPVALPDRVRARVPGLSVVSLGGATEAAIWSIHHPVERVDPEWPSIPYGRPLTNQTFHVLDEAMRDRPDWVPGELYIGGAGVALGYLGDEARTAERFVTHPTTGERLYRTGDVGRYRPGGDIEFLGREDSQVKIRGHRVELAEIETALQAHPAVAAAAVVAVGERDSRRLAAFVETARRAGAGPDDRATAEAAEAARDTARRATAGLDRDDLTALLDAMDEVALSAITRVLTGAGLFPSPEAACDRAAVLAALRADRRHHRLVGRWLDALVRAGRLREEAGALSGLRAVSDEEYRRAWERVADLERGVDYGTEVLEYMRTCADRLSELVAGDLDVRTLLFPGAELDTAGAAYRDNLAIRHLNAAAAAALRRIAEAHRAEEPLRVLEVGAGVGGTTAAAVPALAGHHVDYRFTDVSPFFLTEAREQFVDFPWVSYGLFDINRDIAEQGYAANSFDVVVAANVLHNAIDAAAALRRIGELLAPGGHLVCVETTREHNPPLLVSMEFLDGLDGGHRDVRAEADQTFLTREQWEGVYAEAGARLALTLPDADDRLARTGQTLHLVRLKDDRVPVTAGELARHTAERLPDHMVPAQWRILDALPLTANGKVDRSALAARLPREDTAAVATVSAEPADDLERSLAALWAELLEREHVGRDDDFFALGGDSLLVARMVGRLGEAVPDADGVEWEVVLRHMLRRPTVSGLASYLRDRSGAQESRTSAAAATPYVALNGSGGDPVTALVHAGTGTLVPYRALITEIRRRSGGAATLAGLELPDVAAFLGADPRTVITRWAADYAHALLEGGGRRFHVVGYCLGGLIATEVARTLTEAGAEVASLTAISTHRPPFRLDDELISEYAFAVMMGIDPAAVGFPADENRVSAASDALLEQTPGLLPDGAIGRLEGEYADVAACFRELAAVPREVRVERMCAAVPPSAGSYGPEALHDLFRIFRQSVFAISRYDPEPYAGDVTFLRHSGSYPFPGNKESVTDYWERLVLGDLRIVDVPGDHFSCLSVPYAPGVVKLLGEITGGDVIR
ncbi:amino acid adenylation domain-containing protein [Thermobifida halotolerans]